MDATKTRIDLFLYPDIIFEERNRTSAEIVDILEKRGMNKFGNGVQVEENCDEVVYIWY